MPFPSVSSPSARSVGRVVSSLVLVGWFLGLLPPAPAAEVPPTVVRQVSVDAGRLISRGGVSLSPDGSLRPGDRRWTRVARVCSPVRFTMVGFVWAQTGDGPVTSRIAPGEPGAFAPATEVLADPDEGPDPGSSDDTRVSGTSPLWTGEASCARVRLRLPRAATLRAVRAVFVNSSGTAAEPSLLERAGDRLARAWNMAAEPFDANPASAMAAQPPIISRAQWGANEGRRRCGPDYAPAVQMAYVHHTVNSNAYPKAKADDIVRGIYAYHVRGRKFCDIAYNFLIDRFGRIFEGRYGGIDQPVIGAHAMGFNTGSTGVAAIGNFTSVKPPRKVIAAYKRLLAWRLDVAHVRPTATTLMTSAGGSNTKYGRGQQVTLPVVSGHRDTGYTTCPGARLYARIGRIRSGAEALGMPKIWNPAASPNPSYPGQPIRITAELSRAMTWSVEIAPLTGEPPVRRFDGSGSFVDVTWDRKPALGLEDVPPGTYLATIRASAGAAVARDATITLTLY